MKEVGMYPYFWFWISLILFIAIIFIFDRRYALLRDTSTAQPNPNTAKIDRIDVETQNYGLARCVWSDEILKIIKNADKLQVSQ